ncbi:dynein light chain Tctex-type [Drosophila mojavensis]|uniref:Dynein light chain n=1 Tax=Drosophila mojavensis TaxID=7230 RepID=B4L146_DROMO|nr:dynein light chain Tctex-type [Drosophila mojavensis]EDW18203.1 uncharacterized protein Dmoj_GI13110 [Drosophila mojavensis]
MSSINKKSPKGSTVRATAGEKSRSSNRGSDKKADGASSEVSTMPAPVLNESESDSERHSEAQPATDVTIYNAYDMGPAFGCKFPVPFIRFMVERVMSEKLKGKVYQIDTAAKLTRDVADGVNLKMKGFCLQHRYKHVVNVCLYQQTGAGFFYGFRAVWDTLSDDYISMSIDVGSFICIVSVFGCYQY